MLGSHNTLTYFPMKGFFAGLTKCWSECQEKTVQEQYNLGVRYFDIRIKFDKNKPVVVHNKDTYKAGESELTQVFSFMNLKKDCYIRLILDIRSKPKDADNQVNLFKQYISKLQQLYPNLHIDDAIVYWTWEHIIQPTIQVTEKHASVTSTMAVIKTPKNYAKNHNKEIREQYKDIINNPKQVLLIDYVNI